MTTITYKNIEADYSYTDDDDLLGYNEMTISGEDFSKFIQENDNVVEYGQDDVDEWLKKYDEESELQEDFTTRNSDLQILIFNWMLDQEKTFSIEYNGKDEFWFYHHMQHAENDVQGGTIYVDAEIEEQRIFDALKYMIDNGVYHFDWSDVDLINSFEEAFRQRWNYSFNIDKALEITGLYNEYYGVEEEDDDEVKDRIRDLGREEIIEQLESIGVACYDDEDTELLVDAFFDSYKAGDLEI